MLDGETKEIEPQEPPKDERGFRDDDDDEYELSYEARCGVRVRVSAGEILVEGRTPKECEKLATIAADLLERLNGRHLT